MAATWIKMRTDLRNHPKVVRMASALKADRLRVIGGLWSVWGTFDTHSTDGLLEGYTITAIDDDLNWRGFAAAMQAVGWLDESDSGLAMPRFEDHNGTSAKRRALDADRKKSLRDADPEARGSWNQGGQMSASDADDLPPREELEKRRTNTPPTPKGEQPSIHDFPPGFPEFWAAYPKKVGKDAAAKAFKRKASVALLPVLLAAIQSQKAWPSWQKDGGQYIPNPATWLNEGRWQDEHQGGAAQSDDIFAGAR